MPRTVGLVFPVETINRELDHRLWLASLLASEGRSIFIAEHDVAFELTTAMRHAVYVGKNLFLSRFPCDLGRYRAAKEVGTTLVHFDEEGLSPGRTPELWARALDARLDPAVLAPEDHVATWGTAQADHYRARHPAPERVRVTGQPRFDLLKPGLRAFYAAEVAALRDRFGDFILVNTNLVHANNGLGLADSFTNIVHGYDPASHASRLEHFNGWSLQSHLLANLVKLVVRISVEQPGTSIVVRPHPSENWDYYRTVFQGIPNVHVVHEGSVAPWLLACRVLIHDACTTAIEAHFAGKPVIDYRSYEPEVPWPDDFWLPAIFGARCTREGEVIDVLGRLGDAPETRAARFDDAAHALLENFRTDLGFAPLVDTVNTAVAELPADTSMPSIDDIRRRQRLRDAKAALKGFVRPLFPAKHSMFKFLHGNLFYGFDAEVVGSKLAAIERATGRRVRCEHIGASLMCITSA